MKKISLFLLLTFLTTLKAQENIHEFTGAVYFQTDGQPVSGLKITDASYKLSCVTSDTGIFHLKYKAKKKQKSIDIHLKIEGYVIINGTTVFVEVVSIHELNKSAPNSSHESGSIYVYRKGEKDKLINEYKKSYKKLCEEFKAKNLQNDKLKSENYLLTEDNKNLNKLNDSLYTLLAIQTAQISRKDASENWLNFTKALETGVLVMETYKKLDINEIVYDAEAGFNALEQLEIVASISLNNGDFKTAVLVYQKLIQLKEKYNTDRMELARHYLNYSKAFRGDGQTAKALQYALNATTIAEKEYGKKAPEIIPYYNIAYLLYDEMGSDEIADEYAHNITKIAKEKNIPTDEFVIYNNNKAVSLANKGSHSEAIKYIENILPLVEKEFGTNSLELAAIYYNAAFAYCKLYKFNIGIDLFKKAIVIYESIPGNRIAETHLLKTYFYTADCMRQIPNYNPKLSEEYLRKAITLATNLKDENLPYCYRLLGQIYLANQCEDAIIQLNYALKLFEEKKFYYILDIDYTYFLIGQSSLACRDFTVAQQNFEKIINTKDQGISALTNYYLGLSKLLNNDHEGAKKYLEMFEKDDSAHKGMINFSWFAYYAFENETEKAFNFLDKAVKNEWEDALTLQIVAEQEQLTTIKNDPRYTKILKKLKDK